MPSPIHNAIVELLEAHPEALAYLLTLHGAPPSGPLVPTADTHARTLTIERRLDRAFLVGARKAPEIFFFAEIQLDPDDEKAFSWPLSMELGRSRYRCEGALVVLTLSPAVRRWIEKTIAPPTGTHGTTRHLRPTVIALDELEPELLLRSDMPYLAPLAVAAHADAPDGFPIVERAVDLTLEELPTPLAREQLDVILAMVNTTFIVRLKERAVERRSGEHVRQFVQDVSEALAARALAEGKAQSILTVLSARGVPVSAPLQKRILACTSVELLDEWLRRAVDAPTAAAVVDAPRPDAGRAAAKHPRRRPHH